MVPGKRSSDFPLPHPLSKKPQQAPRDLSDVPEDRDASIERTDVDVLPSETPRPRRRRPPLRIETRAHFAPSALAHQSGNLGYIHVTHEDPTSRYTRVKAGSDIFHRHDSALTIVVMRTHCVPKDRKVNDSLRWKSHSNVLEILEVFYHDGILSIVYEDMELSLHEILCGPSQKLVDREIAAVYKEVLLGLEFIHDKLDTPHGALTEQDVLVWTRGSRCFVKVGYFGISLVQGTQIEKAEDIKSLREILLRIKEPENTTGEPDRQNPDWQENSLAFFSQTHSCPSVTDLLKTSFIRQSPGPQCLKKHVRRTPRL